MQILRAMAIKSWAMAAGGALGAWNLVGRALAASAFRGKTVLITGGSRGLGLVLARELAQRGARLALCARDQRELDETRAELAHKGAQVLAVRADVSDPEQAASFVEQAVARFGGIDVLVNNASIIQVAPLDSMSLADFQAAMQINYFGMVHTTLAALAHLERTKGRIVNVCSIGGAVPVPHLLPYTASKFASVGFSEGLAAEVARKGIRVVTVLPGLMRTGSFLQALFKGRRSDEVTWFSLGASLPFTTVSAQGAARRILRACATGESHVTIGLPAQVLRVVHALWPATTTRVLGLVDRLLPAPGGAGKEAAAEPGFLHRSAASRGPWNKLGDQAAAQNREVPHAEPV